MGRQRASRYWLASSDSRDPEDVMKVNLTGLIVGVGIGFVMSWARLTNPGVIRDMLLLREPDVYLLMGSTVFVAAIGARLLRAAGARALITREIIAWTVERPRPRHL